MDPKEHLISELKNEITDMGADLADKTAEVEHLRSLLNEAKGAIEDLVEENTRGVSLDARYLITKIDEEV